MASTQELLKILRQRRPDTVCLGGVCYFRLENGNLAKAELTSTGGYSSGLRLTILNPRFGAVDSLTLHSRDLPRNTGERNTGCEESAAWDIYRPKMNISALAEMAEKYLRLFR